MNRSQYIQVLVTESKWKKAAGIALATALLGGAAVGGHYHGAKAERDKAHHSGQLQPVKSYSHTDRLKKF